MLSHDLSNIKISLEESIAEETMPVSKVRNIILNLDAAIDQALAMENSVPVPSLKRKGAKLCLVG